MGRGVRAPGAPPPGGRPLTPPLCPPTTSQPPGNPALPLPQRKPAPFFDLFKILVVAFTLYYTWFAVHFSLLPNTGDGDAFMRVRWR
jgi:hypothetical protein